jgi:hypothetical protein
MTASELIPVLAMTDVQIRDHRHQFVLVKSEKADAV